MTGLQACTDTTSCCEVTQSPQVVFISYIDLAPGLMSLLLLCFANAHGILNSAVTAGGIGR